MSRIRYLKRNFARVSKIWDDDNDPNTPTVSRWQSLHEAVELIGSTFNDSMNLGAQLFPSTDAVAVLGQQACLVNDPPEVVVDAMNFANIVAGIPPAGALNLEGGTPAEAGVSSAVNHLMTVENPNPDLEDPAPYIVLITDGAANCSSNAQSDQELLNYDQNLVPTVQSAMNAGIPTFVVGVDIQNEIDNQGINPFEVLNDAALAGGVPKDDPTEKFYNTVNKIELEEALNEIVDTILSCTVPIDGGVPDMTELKVEIGGMKYPDPLPPEADCETEDGWRFTDESMTAIELCGGLCAEFQMSGNVQLNFECFAPG